MSGWRIRQFGNAECVRLENGGLSCEILTYGGALRCLNVPGRNGRSVDVVLGFDSLEDYMEQTGFLGALIGRFGNRIGNAEFKLDGKRYELFKNDGANHLHGGRRGFDKRIWKIEARDDTKLALSLVSEDGEEGYPGRLEVYVLYALKEDALEISYRAFSDAETLCNLTNHAYFNLSGHESGTVEKQLIKINASHYTPTDAGLIPTGEIADVTGTPMDLREPVVIGERADLDFEALRFGGGFDHNYAIDGADGTLRLAAVAESRETGIVLETWTTLPGVQFYSGNGMAGLPKGKNGAPYDRRWGFCLETQVYPDAPHHANFPSALLKKGAEYRTKTVYRFAHKD